MATPSRLIELRCPRCGATHWEIDCDYRRVWGTDVDYPERPYPCPRCGHAGPGYVALRKSPPAFFLQPHPLYPMRRKEFDHWAEVLKANFPDHPLVGQLGKEFRPNARVWWTRVRNLSDALRWRAERRYKEWKWNRGR